MNPRFIFFMMVLIIVVLWFTQKKNAQKSAEFTKSEGNYYEAINKFSRDEISKEELEKVSSHYFQLLGLNTQDFESTIQKDLSVLKNAN